jgi:hypothetical protein
MGASAAFATVAIVLALRSVAITCSPVRAGFSTYPVPFACSNNPTEFMIAVIFGVASGVAFFSGLACFFWSVQRRW